MGNCWTKLSVICGLCVAMLVAPGVGRAADLTIYAAASLRDALDDIAEAWGHETGGELTLVYAGSSALARQIEAGASADLVILANTAWMQHLQDRGAFAAPGAVPLLSNRLVIIGAWHEADALDLGIPNALVDRLGRGRFALALTEAVPAGIYARQALETLDLWDGIAPRVVEADNVRAALAMVAFRAADLGIVYATDAAADRRVTILAEIPEDAHDPIRYPVAMTQTADEAAADLLHYLQGPIGRAIFTGHGFGLLDGAP